MWYRVGCRLSKLTYVALGVLIAVAFLFGVFQGRSAVSTPAVTSTTVTTMSTIVHTTETNTFTTTTETYTEMTTTFTYITITGVGS